MEQNRIKRLISLWLLLLLTTYGSWAQGTTDSELKKANDFFNQSRLKEAEAIYTQLINKETQGSYNQNMALFELGRIYSYRGEYDKAEKTLLKAQEQMQYNPGKLTREYTAVLNKTGELYIETYRNSEAEKVLQEAIKIRKGRFGIQSPEYAESLLFLAQLCFYTDKKDEAAKLIDEAGKIILSRTNGDEFLQAFYYQQVALLSYYNSDMPAAEANIDKGYKIYEKHGLKMHPTALTIKEVLAIIYIAKGEYNKTMQILTELLPITEKHFGKTSSLYIAAAENLAMTYIALNKFPESIELFNHLLDEIKKSSDNQDFVHYKTIGITNGLAKAYLHTGEYSQSVNMYKESLKWRKALYGENSIFVVNILINIGNLYIRMSNWAEADAYFSEAYLICERNEEFKSHMIYPSLLIGTAAVCREKGMYNKATEIFEEIEQLLDKTYSKSHPVYISYLNQLGLLGYKKDSKAESLENIHLKNLQAIEAAEGKNSQYYAIELYNLSSYYAGIGNHRKASALKEEAMAILNALSLSDNSEYCIYLCELAHDYQQIKEYGKAEACYREALTKMQAHVSNSMAYLSYRERETFWNSNAVLFDFYLDYANDNKKREDALSLAYNSQLFSKSLLLDIERKHQQIASQMENTGDTNLYLLINGKKNTYKENEEQIRRIGEKLIGDIIKQYPDLLEGFAQNYQKDLDTEGLLILVSPFENEKKELEETKAYLEEAIAGYETMIAEIDSTLTADAGIIAKSPQLAESAKNFRQRQAEMAAELEDLLQEQTVLEEYEAEMLATEQFAHRSAIETVLLLDGFPALNIERMVQKSKDKSLEQAYKQAVELQKRNQNLKEEIAEIERRSLDGVSFDLNRDLSWENIKQHLDNNEAAIEFLCFASLKKGINLYGALILRHDSKVPVMIELTDQEKLTGILDQSPDKLYDLIWKPIEKHLKGATDLYIASAGLLHGVSIAGVKNANRYLLDQYNIHNILSTKDIIALKAETRQEDTSPKSAALFGGADYGLPLAELADIDNNKQDIARTTRGQGFDYLPGSKAEVQQIDRKLTEFRWTTSLYVDKQATETRFKSLSSRSPNVIHISTHGFYFPELDFDYETFTETSASNNKYRNSSNPLMRSGLAFAGANLVWRGEDINSDTDDGILTAHEVSSMNLSTTELVVLSACDTGLGDIIGSEGVYGLQRAFRLAGINAMIVSLWKVPDKETVELMTLFYSGWFAGQDIRRAFVHAQKKMRDAYPAEPRKWAGFVLIEN